ncbi:MAG: hypothetical protein AB7T27_04350 [Kiritimatiellia bacterium]
MSIMENLPVQIIGRKLYLRCRLEAEGRNIFKCLQSGEARSILEKFNPVPQKRADTDQYYLVKLAYWLNLPFAKPMRILDIGSRYGQWPFLCRHYGHDAVCSDLPEVLALSEIQGMMNILKIPSMPLKIETLKPVGDIGKFDLITGLRTRFHSTKPKETRLSSETHWGVKEWDFFLKDIVTHINPGGQIFFILNRLQEKEKGGGVPAAMTEYFLSRGAQLKGMFLWFKNVEKLRS